MKFRKIDQMRWEDDCRGKRAIYMNIENRYNEERGTKTIGVDLQFYKSIGIGYAGMMCNFRNNRSEMR